MNDEFKRIFLAVVISGFILIFWQKFFAPPPPIVTENVNQQQRVVAPVEKPQIVAGVQVVAGVQEKAKEVKSENVNLTSYFVKNGETEISFNNYFDVTNIYNRKNMKSYEEITGVKNPFSLFIKTEKGIEKIFFDFTVSRNTFSGQNNKYGIILTADLDEVGRLNIKLASSKSYLYNLQLNSIEKTLGQRKIRQFLVYTDSVSREKVGESETFDANLGWAGIDFNYHLFALIFPQNIPAFTRMDQNGAVLQTVDGQEKKFNKGVMNISLSRPLNNFNFSMVFNRKEYDELKAIGHGVDNALDFGFFAVISIWILRGLQWIHVFIPNYGLGIILLTLVMRIVTFPLQLKSIKSMKKMQIIQPELNKLKEKFKDNPQRMQKESMELFKRAGANPLGGCLPMLAQMPIFFAFYSVLREAIELVNAPFFGWISDLSIKDPFYVLPVLMGISMFLQQKLMPTTTTDPNQQKIMMFMPIIFSFIMMNLPAGLTLYILISTLFGICQQVIVARKVT